MSLFLNPPSHTQYPRQEYLHKPINTIRDILRKPKDRPEKDAVPGVVYKIPCSSCEKAYIGQTSRSLKSRLKEHVRAVAIHDQNSLLAKHCAETQHEFDFKETQIIDREKQWHKRLFLEAWHSIADPNSINEHIQIPRSYHIFNCE